ncbi:cation:proton antiporter [Rothia sp. ZJ932]|nr:cation:proton antiporter [Rothia sp. ZJ1223]QRZ62495.1 cation:proton antiporter [Rothia sp. ZJ932]
MTIVVWICGIILTFATVGALYRLWKGPTLLDRVVASDVILTIIGATVCINMVYDKRYDLLPMLAVVSTIGFIGSVTVARFASNAPVSSELDTYSAEELSDDLATGTREDA